jgi:hypothetical protein
MLVATRSFYVDAGRAFTWTTSDDTRRNCMQINTEKTILALCDRQAILKIVWRESAHQDGLNKNKEWIESYSVGLKADDKI